jgi:hypothetical protein
MDTNPIVVSVVCQWCERVIREGESGRELVTCLRCAQGFGATIQHPGPPMMQPTDQRWERRALAEVTGA